VAQSLTKGIESWASVDLPVLSDALQSEPATCSVLQMAFPAKDGAPPRVRRAVLGNVAYFAKQPAPAAGAGGAEGGSEECDHSFCNCCFLTRNFEAFRWQLEGERCRP
jgi:hypothetical protein